MMETNNKWNTDIILKKNRIIDNAITVLKKEFVGIDDQIDVIMKNVRTWYLFSNVQTSPLIINLFGMTGCGKSSLVRRIAELLDEDKNMLYWNFAEFNDQNAWSIEQDIEDEISNDTPNRIIVYDEFQYAATLDTMGGEKDIKSGLKPFWELLDTGIIHKKNAFNGIKDFCKLLNILHQINVAEPMVIENGVWTNMSQCLMHFGKGEINYFKGFLSIQENSKKKQDDSMDDECMDMYIWRNNDDEFHSAIAKEGFFIRGRIWRDIRTMYDKCVEPITNIIEFTEKCMKFTIDDWFDFIQKLYFASLKGYELNFKNSVIFVLANLDEAYDVAFNVDPDMSADQFHEQTKKITIVDIKEALQKRFRNEQIARLGNICVTYPAFSSDSFKKIIELSINNYINEISKIIPYNIIVDDTVKDLIYNESVFPTHGTRPIFSSIHEIIKSKLPIVLVKMTENNIVCDDIKYVYNNGTHSITAVYIKDGNEIFSYTFEPETLRVVKERESECDEKQAMVALHESAHFVMYAKHHHSLPEKVCSKTASTSANGFLLKKADDMDKMTTAEIVKQEIEIALAGYVAEKKYFQTEKEGGTGVSNGASEDLRVATALASRYVRNWGMNGKPFVTTYIAESTYTQGGSLINVKGTNMEESINNEIMKILSDCENRVLLTLTDFQWHKMFAASAKYLSTHSVLSKNKMEEFYNLVSEKKRNENKRDDNHFRNIIDKL